MYQQITAIQGLYSLNVNKKGRSIFPCRVNKLGNAKLESALC